MSPANCAICGMNYSEEQPPRKGEWVEFSDYAYEQWSLDDPEGMAYFCRNHIEAARVLKSKTLAEALAYLKNQFADCPQYKTEKEVPRPSFWKKFLIKRYL